MSARSAFAPILRPMQGTGGSNGRLSREGATSNETGGFEEQGQNQKGQGHHENGHLCIGLTGDVGGKGRGDAGHERHGGRHRHQNAEQGDQPDFPSSGRRRYVHGIDVAILASTPKGNQFNAVRV